VNAAVHIGKVGMIQLKDVEQALLLMYCQAISFYLLLKSEGLAVRDHPVIGRLVEIKNMLKKVFPLSFGCLCYMRQCQLETEQHYWIRNIAFYICCSICVQGYYHVFTINSKPLYNCTVERS
jgi:Sas10/Utp3/C1D family